jgi:hypothetical protein
LKAVRELGPETVNGMDGDEFNPHRDLPACPGG